MRHAYAYIQKNAALFDCCLGDAGLWTLSCVAKACATQKPWAWCLVERWQLKCRLGTHQADGWPTGSVKEKKSKMVQRGGCYNQYW